MALTGPGEFGVRLRRLRERAALTQEDLAERADMTAKAVGALERGERRRPYPRTIRALSDALGLDEAERAGLAAAIRRATAPPRPITGPGALATAPTAMYGRHTEVGQLLDLLVGGTARLVTITGPGGVGKTRLAAEIVRSWPLARTAPVVAELAPVRDVALVLPTVSRALGLLAPAPDLVGSVAALIADRDLLLVIDNMEHLLDAAGGIGDLVARCPRLTVLTTSRAALRTRAEIEFPLGPLALPRAATASALAKSAAVDLFVDRARAVAPGFTVDAANAPAIAAICRRLDGLPLALELAAPHLRYLEPHQLLDRLDRVVEVPGPRDAPARHRTLRATIDWSYDLLTADEQRLLRALSVFAGGFDLDAVERIADVDVLPALQGLVEHSLVVVAEPSGTAGVQRLRTLEPVRSYAAARRTESELAAVADRHAAYFVELGAAARAGLRGPDQAGWLDRLAAEHANLRTALGHLLAHDGGEAAARLGADTWLYWALRGHAGEGLAWWEGVLVRSPELDAEGAALANLALAGLRFATGDVVAVGPAANRAADAWRDGPARALLAEALVLACSGEIFAGDAGAASAHLAELAALVSSLDDGWLRSHALIARAQLALLLGDVDAGREALDAAERLARATAGPFTLATTLNMQATVAQHVGDDDEALARAAEAARVAGQVGTTWTLVYSLPLLALQAARRGRPALAVTLFAGGAAVAEASLLAVSYRPDVEAARVHLDAARAELSADDFRRAWERGRGLSVDDLIGLIPEIPTGREPG